MFKQIIDLLKVADMQALIKRHDRDRYYKVFKTSTPFTNSTLAKKSKVQLLSQNILPTSSIPVIFSLLFIPNNSYSGFI